MYYTNFYTQSCDFVFDVVLIVSYWGPDYNNQSHGDNTIPPRETKTQKVQNNSLYYVTDSSLYYVTDRKTYSYMLT